jgi:outer membrane murein-binding lipoprotein Lpp
MRILSALAIAAVIVLAGCSSQKKVYSANGTTVTRDTASNTVTMQNKEGSMTVGKNAVDPAKLGVPIYPGATQSEGGMSVTSKTGSGQMASFTSPDSFDKVYRWYKSRLPAGAEKMKFGSGDNSVVEFVTGSVKPGEIQTMVMVSQKKDVTDIIVSRGTNR